MHYFRRQKNVATYIVIPIYKNDGTLISGATALDSELDAYADGSAPDGFADCSNEATEIGTTGIYYLSLTQAEMNVDYIIGQTKTTSTGAVVTTWMIETTAQPADIIKISGDATAADNCELMFDGTGYAGGTERLDVNVMEISDDSGAAGNLESACDGTGFNIGGGLVVAASIAAAGITSSSFAANSITAGAIADGAIDAATFAAGAINAAAIAADAIGASELAADAAAEIADAVWDEAIGSHLGVATTGARLQDTYTGATQVGTAGAGLTAIPWNAAWDAEVQSEATDALNAYDPPTNAEMEARTILAGSYFDPAADTVANVTTVGSVTGNVGGNVTGSVGSVAAGGITAASIATDAIDADALKADAVTEIVNAILTGDLSAGGAWTLNERTVRAALAFLRNKWSVAAGTLTVCQTDDATTAWTAAVTGTTGADPITASDPTGP